jgi:RNA polymerase sigma-70 factor (ECF subfamily)
MTSKKEQMELLRRAREGDFDAFAALTEPHRESACMFIAQLTGESDAEDVFMTALLKAWKSINTFSERSSYKTWLFSITRFTALDYLRSRKARKEVSTEDEEIGLTASTIADSDAESPSLKIQADEKNEIIKNALNELSQAHKEVIELYYYQDFKYNEIANILDISVGTVMSRLHHAKSNLAKTLEQHKNELL